MCTFLKHFSCFNTGCQKEGQNEPRGLPKWSPKRPPGPPGRVKSRWEISPEAPRKIAMNFFSPPGGSGSVLGISRGGSWSPLGAQEGPGGLQEPFWHHFWSQNGAPRLHFSSFFWTPWGSILVTCALCSLRPRVYVAAGCLLGDVSLLFLSALCSPLAAKVVPKMEPRDLIFSILGIIPVAVISTVLARRNARSD